MSAWALEDIPWDAFEPTRVNPEVLKVIKTAALVERNGADYGAYLTNVFAGDDEFCTAARTWAEEQELHGIALGKWAMLADPTFDFDAAFARFKALYRIPVDSEASVRGSRTAELCARCVVESGTSSFYSAIRDAVDEPVLHAICKRIAMDEFRHYKLFFRHLARYQIQEPLGTLARLKVVVTRFRETSDDELSSAYYAGNEVQEPYNRAAANQAYAQRAMAFYRRAHIQSAGEMMARAAGLNADGWLAKAATSVLWQIITAKGRRYRTAVGAT